jgi:hypothetical protein
MSVLYAIWKAKRLNLLFRFPQTQHLMVIGVAVVRAARKSQTITHKPDKHA